jgi:ABC-type Na+ transport system ATPase subunit NatA
MSAGQMIEVRGLTKRYGATLAVDDLSFAVRPGLVAGFLGPNGAGKTTTMRLILGLDRPTAGEATVGGRRYRDLPAPLREVGALLDGQAVHPGRRARSQLVYLAQSNGIPERRVDEVLGLVGLEGAARRRSGDFSLGMSRRLAIAAALLGDPAVLMFDEPANGLDPEGIVWARQLMRGLAAEGRTVLAFATFLIGQALISGQAPTASFGQPGVLRAVIGAGLCLAALGLFGVALGTLFRHPAAAIAVLVAVVFVLPAIATALSARIERNVEEYWPTMAGAQVTAVIHGTHQLGPWPGFGLMCLFIAATMAAAFLLLARRDT